MEDGQGRALTVSFFASQAAQIRVAIVQSNARTNSSKRRLLFGEQVVLHTLWNGFVHVASKVRGLFHSLWSCGFLFSAEGL